MQVKQHLMQESLLTKYLLESELSGKNCIQTDAYILANEKVIFVTEEVNSLIQQVVAMKESEKMIKKMATERNQTVMAAAI